MCGGVRFEHGEESMQIFFPNPKAVLPVMTSGGHADLLPWGRRKEQSGRLPVTGWARLDSIYAGRWDKYQALPIKIAVQSFMEKDLEGVSHWYELSEGEFIQGLLARSGDERRVYVVTVEPEEGNAMIHSRWPRIIHQSESITSTV